MSILTEFFTKQKQAATPQGEASSVVSQVRGEEYADRNDYELLPLLALRPWDYGRGVEDTTSGYGFTTPDGKIWAAHHCLWSTWDELGVLVVNVVGESFHLEDLGDPDFDPGRPLQLVPEPENPHDPNAIAVRNWTGDKTAGYIKRGSTSRLRNLLRGRELRVMSLSCWYDQPPPAGRRISLTIAIFKPDRLLGADHVPPHPPAFDES